MSLQNWVVIIFFAGIATAHAESVICPAGAQEFITVEAEPWIACDICTKPGSSPPDIGGDYDEKAPQMEWNGLNEDARTKPVTVHCFSDRRHKNYVDVAVPETIKRCIMSKEKFECRSETVSCVGYADQVKLVAIGEDGKDFELVPETKKVGKGKRLVWSRLKEERKGLRVEARCSENVVPNEVYRLDVPADMKECVFTKRRFICTDDPSRHDAFWPGTP